MGTLQLQNINLAYGGRDLLKEVSLTLSARARAALTGANGSGKSTLLRIISGEITSDSGFITTSKGMRISYLPQSDIVHSGTSLFLEVEKGYFRFAPILARKQAIEHELSNIGTSDSAHALIEELHQIQEMLLSTSYFRREAYIEQVLKGLGFLRQDFNRNCEEFSGGWQMRIALAKVLVEEPDVLLLDEPTNYLDIEARIWLRNYIRQFKGMVVMVSHDQDFLDETVEEVYELFNGNLTRYSGNYSAYQKQRTQELEQIEKAFRIQQKEIERTQQFIERFRYKASKAKQVQSREKQLEKLEKVEIPPHLGTLSFSFPDPPHSGNDVIIVEGLTKNYGDLPIFQDLSLVVNKGDRLAVTGRNGAGKSTLLRLIAQVDRQFGGKLQLGAGVKIGYFAQDSEDTLYPANTVLEEVEAIADTSDIPRLRTLLGSFLFSNDDVDKRISILSGGEKSRLALAKILLHPANLLLLDEPTSHLDINAKAMLLEALKAYQGTVVFVSHDTHFIKNIANRILYLSEDPPELFEGDYSYFSWKLEQKEAFEPTQTEQERVPPQLKSDASSSNWKETNRLKNRYRNLQKEAEELLTKIDKKQETISAVIEEMALEHNYIDSNRITALITKKTRLEKEHTQMEEQWFALHEEIHDLEVTLGVPDSHT
ncbi:MAG: ABC-F family ATP-binding cassette domain-containing protein [Sphaerochaetaceae bacterium]